MAIYPSETLGGTPQPSDNAEIQGIFQSDLLIFQALQYGLKDIQENQWLLDYAFAGLKIDPYNKAFVGNIEAAKYWFNNTQIHVTMAYRTNDMVKFPAITVGLAESTETENQLGDINPDTSDAVTNIDPPYAGPFTPKSYNAITGKLVTPAKVNLDMIAPEMVVVTQKGNRYPILTVDEEAIYLEPGTRDDFRQCVIKSDGARYKIAVESARFNETYIVGCHVTGDPNNLVYLYTIVKFILLRYRQALLEARGFERSIIKAGEFRKDDDFGNEVVYSRFLTVSGTIIEYWPKTVGERITHIVPTPQYNDPANPNPDTVTAGWEITAIPEPVIDEEET